MPSEAATQAKDALFEQIVKLAPSANALMVKYLAEARAWLISPDQPHGGGSVST